ncbi:ATP-binding protein [bacterium]|nr:ATP-binding protein [bacterium]
MRNDNYRKRLIDKKLHEYLETFGAVSVEGPKWCGKTWASLHQAQTAYYLDDEQTRLLARLDTASFWRGPAPILLDEWLLVPELWDRVRRQCDVVGQPGQFILTGSTILPTATQKQSIFHSGAGRIARLRMQPMSLFESGDSSGAASLRAILTGRQENFVETQPTLQQLARLIVRGGWPANLTRTNVALIPRSYIETIINTDMSSWEQKKRDSRKMRLILKSLSRNESEVVSEKTLMSDIDTYESETDYVNSRTTLRDYLDVLERLYLLANQLPYECNYRAPQRVGKAVKRHFVDPSLAAACLGLTPNLLLKDLATLGTLFEGLVIRDLRVYMDYLDGEVLYFRDNVTGLEADAVLGFGCGEYILVEVKLGFNQVGSAIKNLRRLQGMMTKKPTAMMVIVGLGRGVYRDPQSGVYVVPITSLRE